MLTIDKATKTTQFFFFKWMSTGGLFAHLAKSLLIMSHKLNADLVMLRQVLQLPTHTPRLLVTYFLLLIFFIL